MDAFSDEQRAAFEASAEELRLERGAILLRRGEPGGDLFLLREGALEAVDTRSTPEVIVAVLRPGHVVGELSFLDGSPRSMDVRVGHSATVLRWGHRDLRALLKREPILAATFYESVAKLASTRMRRLSDNVFSGALTPQTSRGSKSAVNDANRLVQTSKAALLRIDSQLREVPDDPGIEASLRDELNDLQSRFNTLLESWPSAPHRAAIAEVFQRELHPYFVRSVLADRTIRRPQGVTATAEILSHLLVNRAAGDGTFGQIVDRWLLDRPLLAGVRTLTNSIPEIVLQHLPTHRNRRVLVLNAGTGSLIAKISQAANLAPTTISVVDPSREALQFLDTDVAPIHQNVTVHAIQENLAEFAVGRRRHVIAPTDVVVIHGLLEYLPDRLAVSLVRECSSLLNKEGTLLVATLSDSQDRAFLDRMLRWPMLPRSPQVVARILENAGLHGPVRVQVTGPALIWTAHLPG